MCWASQETEFKIRTEEVFDFAKEQDYSITEMEAYEILVDMLYFFLNIYVSLFSKSF